MIDRSKILEEVKLYIDVDVTDDAGISTDTELKLDALLNSIIKNTENQLRMRIGLEEIPADLEFIILEVTIRRYNRIGSEGMESESSEGYSVRFDGDDFKPYESLLKPYLADDGWQMGGVFFL